MGKLNETGVELAEGEKKKRPKAEQEGHARNCFPGEHRGRSPGAESRTAHWLASYTRSIFTLRSVVPRNIYRFGLPCDRLSKERRPSLTTSPWQGGKGALLPRAARLPHWRCCLHQHSPLASRCHQLRHSLPGGPSPAKASSAFQIKATDSKFVLP